MEDLYCHKTCFNFTAYVLKGFPSDKYVATYSLAHRHTNK
jgi:hypothetical protein